MLVHKIILCSRAIPEWVADCSIRGSQSSTKIFGTSKAVSNLDCISKYQCGKEKGYAVGDGKQWIHVNLMWNA